MIITSLYAALLVVLFIVLSARIIAFRRGKKINLGDGEDEAMRRRIRAQANCAEYAPFGILMMGIAETLSAHPALLHLMGIMLLVGRIMHAYGINSREVPALGYLTSRATNIATPSAHQVSCNSTHCYYGMMAVCFTLHCHLRIYQGNARLVGGINGCLANRILHQDQHICSNSTRSTQQQIRYPSPGTLTHVFHSHFRLCTICHIHTLLHVTSQRHTSTLSATQGHLHTRIPSKNR